MRRRRMRRSILRRWRLLHGSQDSRRSSRARLSHRASLSHQRSSDLLFIRGDHAAAGRKRGRRRRGPCLPIRRLPRRRSRRIRRSGAPAPGVWTTGKVGQHLGGNWVFGKGNETVWRTRREAGSAAAEPSKRLQTWTRSAPTRASTGRPRRVPWARARRGIYYFRYFRFRPTEGSNR